MRDLTEMFLERGFLFTHEAVREWEARFAPLLADQLRAKRKGQVGRSWYVDETYIKMNGQWWYLYRAIDRDGNLVDSMLSETRDMDAAQRFFCQAKAVTGSIPERVTTDGHPSYPRAIRETLGEQVEHRSNQYLNNAWNRTIAGSSSGTIQCAGSAASKERLASVAPSTNYGSLNGIDGYG